MADLRVLKENACFVFRKYYKDLSTGLQNHLPTLVTHVYSVSLVSKDNRNKILDQYSNTSQLDRCMWLLNDVEDRIERDHSALNKFCEALCSQEVGLSDLGEQLRYDFQQLCNTSANPTFHGSYMYNSLAKSTEPVVDSATTDEGTHKTQPSRLVKYDIQFGGSVLDRTSSCVQSFATPQQVQVQDDGTDGGYGKLEQVVPAIKESSRPERAKTVSPYVDLVDASAGHSVRDQEFEEKRLYSDMLSSWYRVTRKCENCAKIQAEYESKLEKMKEYYDKCLKGDDTKVASVRCVKKLEEDKRHLIRAMDLQSEEKLKQLKEKEQEIEQLQCQVGKQKRELIEIQELLECKRKELEGLKTDMSLKEKKLYDVNQSAKRCPVYGNKKKRASFERKKKLCDEIQSLATLFFVSQDPHEKSKLKEKVQAILTHFTSFERRKSFSL